MTYEVQRSDTFMALLDHAKEIYGSEIFIATQEHCFFYNDFYKDIFKVAGYFKNITSKYMVLGLKNQYHFAVCYFASILTGHIAVLIPEEKAVPGLLREAYKIIEEEWEHYLSVTPASKTELNLIHPEDICTIAFSSGTTSKNKGCMLSQKNLLDDAEYTMMYYQYWEGERLVHILPYWHLFGLVSDLIGPLHYGCSLYVPDSPAYFFKALQVFKPNSINMPPALAEAMCNMIEKYNIKAITGGNLTKILCAGAPLNRKISEKLMSFGILPCTAYGLTECSPCISITPDHDVRIGTAGKPIPCVELRFEDQEILVSGSTLMKGYFEDEELTRSKIKGDFLYTGDKGYLDECGHLVIMGRKDNMLVFANGIKCVPEMIEERINSMDTIEESLLVKEECKNPLPKLILVTENLDETVHNKITEIMKEESLYPYLIEVQREKLTRNTMGKVIRK